MNLYVMRHGTTVWNEKGIVQGRSNNRLSSAGKRLISNVSETFKEVKIDAIVCSPLARAVQTANIMNKFHNVKVFKDYILNDVDQGVFTGRLYNSLSDEERILKENKATGTGMETFEQCFNRMNCFLKNIKKNYPYNNLLVVTHSSCAGYIEDIIKNNATSYSNLRTVRKYNNAEIVKYVI